MDDGCCLFTCWLVVFGLLFAFELVGSVVLGVSLILCWFWLLVFVLVVLIVVFVCVCVYCV